MTFKVKKYPKQTHHDRVYLLINLLTIACVAILVLLIDNLEPGATLWGARHQNRPANKVEVDKVLASSTPNFSLSSKTSGCDLLIFSWQPVATWPVNLTVYKKDGSNKAVFNRRYDVGTSVAFWPNAQENNNYEAALYLGDLMVSEKISVKTPQCDG